MLDEGVSELSMLAGTKGGLDAGDPAETGSFVIGGSARTGDAGKLVECISIWLMMVRSSPLSCEVEEGIFKFSTTAGAIGRAARAGDPAESSLIKFVALAVWLR